MKLTHFFALASASAPTTTANNESSSSAELEVCQPCEPPPKRLKANEFACDKCDRAFSDKSNLRRHKHIHSEEKPFACDKCDKTFAQKGNLESHKRVHSGEKPYCCDVCDKAFAQKAHLEVHKRTHSGQKPFACDKCDKAFAYKHSLDFHKRAHTGEKPYHCEFCDKAFADKSGLETHKRTHTEEKPYSCDVCGEKFAYSSNMHDHQNRYHNDRYVAKKKVHETAVSTFLTTLNLTEMTTLGDALPPPGCFKREHFINFNCVEASATNANGNTRKFCRIDFIVNVSGTYVFLEVDENQHRFGYDSTMSCDMKRMSDVMATILLSADGDRIGGIFWLRYNPCAWHVDGNVVRVPKELRLRMLGETLLSIQRADTMRIGYMFYDSKDGSLEVLDNEEYNPEFKASVVNLTPNPPNPP